jgi:hypothetical protein
LVSPHGSTGSTLEQPGSTLEQPGSTLEQPGSTLEQPGSTLEQPGSTLEQPGSTLEQPGSTLEQPGSTLEQPGSTLEQPGSTLEQPGSTCGRHHQKSRPAHARLQGSSRAGSFPQCGLPSARRSDDGQGGSGGCRLKGTLSNRAGPHRLLEAGRKPWQVICTVSADNGTTRQKRPNYTDPVRHAGWWLPSPMGQAPGMQFGPDTLVLLSRHEASSTMSCWIPSVHSDAMPSPRYIIMRCTGDACANAIKHSPNLLLSQPTTNQSSTSQRTKNGVTPNQPPNPQCPCHLCRVVVISRGTPDAEAAGDQLPGNHRAAAAGSERHLEGGRQDDAESWVHGAKHRGPHYSQHSVTHWYELVLCCFVRSATASSRLSSHPGHKPSKWR